MSLISAAQPLTSGGVWRPRYAYLLCAVILSAVWLPISAQYPDYVRHHAEALSADSMHGRGYVADGLHKAEDYLVAEFRALGLRPLGDEYRQEFTHSIHTFPGRMEVSTKAGRLRPGEDYIVDPACSSIAGRYRIKHIDLADEATMPSEKQIARWKKKKNLLLAIDWRPSEAADALAMASARMARLSYRIPVAHLRSRKLTWGASFRSGAPIITLASSALDGVKKVDLDIEGEFVSDFRSANVMGYVEGSTHPDSFIVFTAHYDHLGMMGSEATFNGANDNASGTAVMLSLAKHYAMHQPEYSCLFIAFAGEEAGLLGSRYYVEHPTVPLDQMRFLINLDLFASGVDGITLVNATNVPDAYRLMTDINEEMDLLPVIKERGPAANSDHHFFVEAGVPAVFIYALGGNAAYHDIHDTYEKLTFEEYPDIFRLLTTFVERY